MGVGELLDSTFRIFRRHLASFWIVSLICQAPVLVAAYPSPFLATGLSIASYGLQMAAVTWLSARAILGEPMGRAKSLGFALRKFFPFWIGVTLLGFVGMMIVMPVVLVLMGVGGAFAAPAAALLLFPFLLWIWIRIAPWAQVLLIEGQWSFIPRALVLTRGSFWRIAAITLLGMILTSIPAALAQVSNLWASGELESLGGETPISPQPSSIVVGALISALIQPFAILLTTFLYYELRVRSEGFDVDREVDAFEAALASDQQP